MAVQMFAGCEQIAWLENQSIRICVRVKEEEEKTRKKEMGRKGH